MVDKVNSLRGRMSHGDRLNRTETRGNPNLYQTIGYRRRLTSWNNRYRIDVRISFPSPVTFDRFIRYHLPRLSTHERRRHRRKKSETTIVDRQPMLTQQGRRPHTTTAPAEGCSAGATVGSDRRIRPLERRPVGKRETRRLTTDREKPDY